MRQLFRLILFLFASGPALAEPAPEELAPVPEPPELPMPIQSGEEMAPDITITRKGRDMIHEYRRNGKLVMIKVQPDVGPPYYMLDTNGDGEMDVKKNDLDKNTNVNQWILFEWD